jgi:hypothetical protein
LASDLSLRRALKLNMSRHYYDQRRFGSRHNRGGGNTFKYIFPFLLLIVLGIVFVLGFRLLYSYFWSAEGDGAYLYVVEGQAQIKMWGTDDYVKAYDGTRVLQGDEVYVARDSKVVVDFYDQMVVRLNGATEVIFNEIYDEGGDIEVDAILKNGEMWVNKTSASGAGADFSVLSGDILVKLSGGGGVIFDIENLDDAEVVRVFYGEVETDVYSQNGGTIVDHVIIDEGNQAIFDQAALGRFWKFQAPNVIENITSDFLGTPWYTWNLLEDEDPSDYYYEEVVEEEVVEEAIPEIEEVSEVETEVVEPEVVELEPLELGPLSTPVILEVNGQVWDDSMFEEGLEVEAEPIKVVGSVSGAEQVVINGYTLQRFEPVEGEEAIVYWMAVEYENLSEGENIYEVYALSPDGVRSVSSFFKVIYNSLVEEAVPEEEKILPLD